MHSVSPRCPPDNHSTPHIVYLQPPPGGALSCDLITIYRCGQACAFHQYFKMAAGVWIDPSSAHQGRQIQVKYKRPSIALRVNGARALSVLSFKYHLLNERTWFVVTPLAWVHKTGDESVRKVNVEYRLGPAMDQYPIAINKATNLLEVMHNQIVKVVFSLIYNWLKCKDV